MLPIDAPEPAFPDAMFAIRVVPSACISSITIQYTRFPVPAVLCEMILDIQIPGIIVVVDRVVAGVTKCAIIVSPSAVEKFVVVIFVCVPVLGSNIRLSEIGETIGALCVASLPSK